MNWRQLIIQLIQRSTSGMKGGVGKHNIKMSIHLNDMISKGQSSDQNKTSNGCSINK